MPGRILISRPFIRPPAFHHLQPKQQTRWQSSSPYALEKYLVTPHDLDLALKKNVYSKLSTAPRIIPVCASWFMPNDAKKRTGYQSFLESRIPKARFFDLDAVKDDSSPYPHMLPSPELFAKAMGKLGIRRDDSVVVYDSADLGIFSAPRVAWTLKAFGHDGVHLLNNYKLWVDQGYPVEKGEPDSSKYYEVDYPVPKLEGGKVAAFEELKESVNERSKEGAEEVQILDARGAGRFDGSEAEPRAGLSSGHIPGSINIPFSDVISARTKALLPASELKLYFETKNIDPSKPIICSCGTGVTAAVLDAALTEAGYPEEGRKIYDGSWTEWAQRATEEEGLIKKGVQITVKEGGLGL